MIHKFSLSLKPILSLELDAREEKKIMNKIQK